MENKLTSIWKTLSFTDEFASFNYFSMDSPLLYTYDGYDEGIAFIFRMNPVTFRIKVTPETISEVVSRVGGFVAALAHVFFFMPMIYHYMYLHDMRKALGSDPEEEKKKGFMKRMKEAKEDVKKTEKVAKSVAKNAALVWPVIQQLMTGADPSDPDDDN